MGLPSMIWCLFLFHFKKKKKVASNASNKIFVWKSSSQKGTTLSATKFTRQNVLNGFTALQHIRQPKRRLKEEIFWRDTDQKCVAIIDFIVS